MSADISTLSNFSKLNTRHGEYKGFISGSPMISNALFCTTKWFFSDWKKIKSLSEGQVKWARKEGRVEWRVGSSEDAEESLPASASGPAVPAPAPSRAASAPAPDCGPGTSPCPARPGRGTHEAQRHLDGDCFHHLEPAQQQDPLSLWASSSLVQM